MVNIISPVSKKLLEQELTEDKYIRKTNYGDNQLFIVNYHNSPNVVREIGRLREEAFRVAGGGTGKELDLDRFDTAENPYQQLIVWDSAQGEILGGYRFIHLKNAPRDKDGNIDLATNRLLNISDNFIENYFPYTIELGRSFVQPKFQRSKVSRQALFALDNLWDGLGALIVINKGLKYFFGKVTMYTHFNKEARDMILYFFKKHFPDKDNLIYPKNPIKITSDIKKLEKLFTEDEYKKDYKILSQNVRRLGENIPPLINSYMNLTPSLKVFGTAINEHFGNVEETGMLITIKDIYETKQKRHMNNIQK